MIQPDVLLDAQRAVDAVDRDPGSGLAVAVRAARRAERAKDPAAAATAQRAWGHALLHCGELDEATRHLMRSVRWGERAQSPELVAEARHKLAFAVLQRGRPNAALAQIDAALRDLRGASAARARSQRAVILHVVGRLDESLAESEAALAVLRRHADRLGVQRMLINRSLVHADRHAFAAAERDLREAETLATALGRKLTIGLIANNLGSMETLRGDVPAAMGHLDRAELIIGAHGAQLGTLHQDRAELLLSVGLVTEARVAAARAVTAYVRERRSLKVPEVRLLLARTAFLGGDPAAALVEGRRALRQFRTQDRPEWTELARLAVLRAQLAAGARPRLAPDRVGHMVATLDGAGWPVSAVDARIVAARLHPGPGEAYLEAAAAAARRAGPAALRARGWYARAVLRHRAGDGRGVCAAARAGLRVLAEHSASMGATDLRVYSAAHRAELVELGLRVALDSGDPARVFEWAERGRASQLLPRPVRPPADDELTALLAELRTVTREQADQAVPAPALVARQAALERRIRDRSRLVRGAGTGETAPARPRDLAGVLDDGWALVEFVQLDGRLHALTVADGRTRMHALGTAADAADLVDRQSFALRRLARPSRPDAVVAAGALLRGSADRLDGLLLRPLVELAGRPLVVVPTGPLHSLAWSLLPSCHGRPVTVAPSATLWHRTATHPVRAAAPAAVVAGPRLESAEHEAAAVAAIHGTRALTGAAATVDAVLEALSTSGIAHLAAHGRLSADNPLFSDIVLADGRLVIYDVEGLAQAPHTVVLAACDGGRPVVCTGDELLGLAVAFPARGTAQLVASVIPVPDAATAPVMIAFHEGLAAGRPPAVALADAQRGIDPGDPRAVAAAAGFVCLGAGIRPIRQRRSSRWATAGRATATTIAASRTRVIGPVPRSRPPRAGGTAIQSANDAPSGLVRT